VNQAVIAATLGLGEHEVDDRTAVHVAWKGVFAAAAADRPLVVVIEDLHWASDSILDAVEHLSQPHDGIPILVLTSARPELFDRRPEWPARRRNYLALSLQPLDSGDVESLVRQLAPAEDFQAAVAAARRADGNPVFVGEMVKALLATAGKPHPLPDTVQSAILARLDLLSADHRRLLQIGSVLGLEFPTGWVTAITGVADENAAFQHLVDEEYLLSKPGDVHEFRHILLRDVAYTTLTRAERADLHRRAGDWLAEDAAGRAAPPWSRAAAPPALRRARAGRAK
jgi:predicted ATPase